MLDGLRRAWRAVTRAAVREEVRRRRERAESKLAQAEDQRRMVRDVLGDDIDDGLIGRSGAR